MTTSLPPSARESIDAPIDETHAGNHAAAGSGFEVSADSPRPEGTLANREERFRRAVELTGSRRRSVPPDEGSLRTAGIDHLRSFGRARPDGTVTTSKPLLAD